VTFANKSQDDRQSVCWEKSKEIEDQMQYFAEEVKPLLARACSGQVQNPELGLDF
jgi:hypothetical protein